MVDCALTEDEEIVFNAGTHQDTVRMRYQDFAQLVQPRVAEFARHLEKKVSAPVWQHVRAKNSRASGNVTFS